MRYLTTIALIAGLWFSTPAMGEEAATPIHHVVLVWLKEGVGEETKTALTERTRKLGEIEQIQSLHIGLSLPSGRGIVDDSFDFGIHMVFDGRQDMERYLADERHVGYVENHLKPVLEKVTVYDF